MKIIFFLLILSVTSAATGDVVKKWTDEKGQVHYGDKKAAEDVKGAKTIKIEDTFDQQSYEEGIQRHQETEEIADDLEKQRIQEEEKQRELEQSKPSAPPPAAGRTTIINPPVGYPAYRNRPPGNLNPARPVQLPAKQPR
jgi:hypothetical protein